jgi:para-nitrobenzyl esterase
MAPAKLLAVGHTNPAPLIIGTNTRELAVPGADQLTDAFLAESFGSNEAAARGYYGYLPSGPMPAADARLGSFSEQLSADVTFKCPAARTAALRAASGQPVWQYDFGRIDTARQFGHAAELSSVFDAVPLGAAGDAAAPSLQAFWVRFAHSGDANGPALPRWPRYDLAQRSYMDFAPTGPQPKSDLRVVNCALLQRV